MSNRVNGTMSPYQQELMRLNAMTNIGIKRENTKKLEDLAKSYHAYSIRGNGTYAHWDSLQCTKSTFDSKIQSQADADRVQAKYGQNLNITQVVINARYTSSQASFDNEIDAMVGVLRDFFIYRPVAEIARMRGIQI